MRQHTDLPLGVGFGTQGAYDVRLLHDIADVAIVGSSLLNAYNSGGMDELRTLAQPYLDLKTYEYPT